MLGALYSVRRQFSRDRHPRRAFSLTWVVIPLGVAATASALFAIPWFTHSNAPIIDDSLVYRVSKGTFTHSVTEPGELESSDNVEVKCEVKARGNSQGMKILWIIEAGSLVKPGDLLVKFDASTLEDEKAQQEIVVNNSDALVVQSRNVFETAEIAKREYLNGTFKQEEQVVQSEIFVAEENLRRAEQYAQYSQRLAAKGYVTTLQLEADRFAVDKARKDLQAAQTKLNVLQNFTQAKMLKTLESDIQTARAKLQAAENSFRIDSEKLKFLLDQLSKCEIRAPKAGKVVYANRIGGRDDREVIIEEGAIIREGQPVVRLPDLDKMQVLTRINESKISLIRAGWPKI
jgi:multidrug efflux pump subunit AcrA (membrane-fusion protein)